MSEFCLKFVLRQSRLQIQPHPTPGEELKKAGKVKEIEVPSGIPETMEIICSSTNGMLGYMAKNLIQRIAQKLFGSGTSPTLRAAAWSMLD